MKNQHQCALRPIGNNSGVGRGVPRVQEPLQNLYFCKQDPNTPFGVHMVGQNE